MPEGPEIHRVANKLAKALRSKEDAKEIKNKFSLQEHEVENIFDIIEKEWNI